MKPFGRIQLENFIDLRVHTPWQLHAAAARPWVAVFFHGGIVMIFDVEKQDLLLRAEFERNMPPASCHMYLDANFFVIALRQHNVATESVVHAWAVDLTKKTWRSIGEKRFRADSFTYFESAQSIFIGHVDPSESSSSPRLVLLWRHRIAYQDSWTWSSMFIDLNHGLSDVIFQFNASRVSAQRGIIRGVTLVQDSLYGETHCALLHLKHFSLDGTIVLDRTISNEERIHELKLGSDDLVAIVPREKADNITIANINVQHGASDTLNAFSSFRRCLMLPDHDVRVKDVHIVDGRVIVTVEQSGCFTVHVYSM
jgi:hypothetical protein